MWKVVSFFRLDLYPLRHFIMFFICLYIEKFKKMVQL